MNLWQYMDKHIRVISVNGRIFEGIGDLYTSDADNDWDEGRPVASICVGDYELYEDEIVGIEVIAADVSLAPLARAV